MNKTLPIILGALLTFFISGKAFGQLSGTNTIDPSGVNFSGNPSGVSGKNYTSFTKAVAALKSYGVNSTVTFNVASATYNEQLSVPAITGASASNRIIFQSANNDSTSVIIQYSSANADTNYTISLNDADYITIRKITVKALGSQFGWAILLTNNADHNIIANNYIWAKTNSTSYFAGIYSANTFDQQDIFENNLIEGGFYGIGISGSTSALEQGNIIRNNVIRDFYYYGVSATYQDAVSITGNTIVNSDISGIVQGIYPLYSNNAINISDNKIVIKPGSTSYGINLNGNAATSLNHGKISNNFISVIGTYTGTVYGISANNCAYQDVAYNSVNLNVPASFAFGVYISGTASNGVFLTNNIIANNGGGFAIFTGNTQPLAYSDYNDLYSTGPYVCYYTSNLSSLSAWQTASGKDQNSFSVNPGFISETDLHINNATLNNAGKAISGINTDIDGETRSSTPDIGADEYTAIANDAGVTALVAPLPPCGGSNTVIVKIKNSGTSALTSVTVNWEINGSIQTPVVLSSLSLAQYQEMNVSLGAYNFVHGTNYNLKCWTSDPNAVADGNPKNDTFQNKSLKTGMSGTYTAGNSTSDYLKIKDAVDDLISRGVCGSVLIRIMAGTYKEQLDIPKITGASQSNRITFESYDLDSTKATITYSASSTQDDYVVRLRGAEYITLSKLTISAGGT